MTQDEKHLEVLPNDTLEKNAAKEPLLKYPVGAEDAKSAAVDPEKGQAKGEQEKAVDGVPSASSRVFNRGERPVQDALWGRIFLGGMLLLALRLLVVFLPPVLSLRFYDAASFAVAPVLAIILELLVSVPGCFFLVWSSSRMTPARVRVSLLLCLAFFIFSFSSSLRNPTESPGTAQDTEDVSQMLFENQGDIPSTPSLPSSSEAPPAQGGLGALSGSSLLGAAFPASISRILHESNNLASNHLKGPLGMSPSSKAAARRLVEFFHPAAATESLARRILEASAVSHQHALVVTETFLNNLISGVSVVILLLYCTHLFPLVSLIISDSAKFLITRGRGLIFLVVSVSAVSFLTAVPIISSALQVLKSCETHGELCTKWTSAIDPLKAPLLTILGLFFGGWLLTQVHMTIQFIAAHVVGQCYGNSQVTVEEGDLHTVILATKCAFNESFGTISLLSLVSLGVTLGAVLFNMLIILFMGDFVLAAFPLVLISGALFIFTVFLTSFVVPMVAISGQSFVEAMRSAFFLAKRNVVAAVTATICTLCVVGVLIFFIVMGMTFFGIILAAILAAAGPISGLKFVAWLIILMVITIVTSVGSLTLFHWEFSTTISSTFVLLALEEKAHEGTTRTMLFLAE